ncbi:MAG: beta-Ala-His dipeptidase [Prevotella sp.]|nr:beta-Ala-His dipeptidase [Prevotella sp.]
MIKSEIPIPPVDAVMRIFRKLNDIPRPSHHEERVADFLCQYAESLGLEYRRDQNSCVVIRKAATPGHESATPVAVLNHMDMVCVGMDDPMTQTIVPYEDNGWLKAKGTSLGADNGIGLSMALAVLADDSIVHGPIEVITTTNEEDGMSGAAGLSGDFLTARKVINLDSEDYDTITTGAAGAYLQMHRLPAPPQEAPGGKRRWFRITIEGGKGGHSGVDINKGRASAVVVAWAVLAAIYNEYDVELADIRVGEANASIASSAELVVTVPSGEAAEFVKGQEEMLNDWLKEEYGSSDPGMHCTIEKTEPRGTILPTEAFEALMACLEQIPQGVVKMSETMTDTVETSNNVGRIFVDDGHIVVSTHTRSFIYDDMVALGKDIASVFAEEGGSSELVMAAPAWQERQDSDFLRLTSDTFDEVLGWRPRMVAMHFVLEAGYFVKTFPGIEIACIGPRIVEPHSTAERVELSTIGDIWKVFVTLLARMA